MTNTTSSQDHLFLAIINTTGTSGRAGTAYPSGAPEFTLVGFVFLIFTFLCSVL